MYNTYICTQKGIKAEKSWKMKAIYALLSRASTLIAKQNSMRINFIFAELDRDNTYIYLKGDAVHTSKRTDSIWISQERALLRIVYRRALVHWCFLHVPYDA